MNTEIKITADIKSVEQKLGKVKGTLGSVAEAARGATSMISKLTSSIARVGKISVGFGGVVGAGSFVASEKSFRKFEHSMMEAFTLLPKANKQAFAQMKKDALEFSERYGVSTEEVAAGMYQSLSAGINPKDLKSFMQTAQESAIAGVTDLRTSVDALTNIMNAYGQETYDVEYLSDVLFKGITMSKLTFEELSRYMYQAIPTAAALKLNIVDLVGAISALSATGTLTRVGATQFRQFLVELQDHGSQANTIFRRMNQGISFQQFIAEGGRILDVVESLRRGARAAGLDMANLFSSIEAGNAARQMDNFERFEAMIKETEFNSGGSKNSAFGKMEGTLQKAFDRMKASFFNFFTRIGEVLEPAFRTFYNFTDELSRSLREDIDWQGISKEFEYAWKVLLNVAKGGTDELASYLKNEIKLAVLDAYESIVNIFSKASKFFAQVFSLDSNEFYKLTDALVVVAKNFGMTLVDSLREHLPKIVNLFSPVVAFLQASIQSAIDSLNPFKDEDFDEIRQQKAESFGAIGSKERDEALLRANDEDTRQGLEQYAQKNTEQFLERNNYQNKVLQGELNEDRNAFDKFIYDAYGTFDKKMNEFVPDMLMGRRVLSGDEKIVYGMTAKNILEDQQLRMDFDKLGGHYDIGISLGDAIKKYFDQQNITKENIPLPPSVIDENFIGDGYELDLNQIIKPENFNTKGLMQLRNLLATISKNAEFLENAFPQANTRNLVKGKMNKALTDILGFEQMLLGTLYDAEVGMGLRNEITQDTVQFQREYNQAIEQLNAFAEEMQVYEKNNASNRTNARDKEREEARKQLGVAFDEFINKVGTVDISSLEPDNEVSKDIEQKRDAFLAKRKAFIKKYGQGITLEDPMLAEFGAFDLPKSPAQPPYEIKPLFREITADSKQRVGGGGGAFSFENVQQKLVDANVSLKDAVKDLTQEIKNTLPFVFEDKDEGIEQKFKNFKGIAPVSLPIDDATATKDTNYTQQEIENIFNDIFNTEENIEKNTDVNNSQNIKKTRSTSTQESDSVFTKTKKLDVEISASKTKADDESTQKVSKTSSAINLVKDVKNAVQSFISSDEDKSKSVKTLLENIKSSARTFKEDVTQKSKATKETNQSATLDKSILETKKLESLDIKTFGQVLISSAKRAFTSNTSEDTKKLNKENITTLGENIQKDNIVSSKKIDDKIKTDANKVSIDTINAEVNEINISKQKDTSQRDTKDEQVNRIENNSINRALVNKSISSSTDLNKQSDALSTDEQATTSKEDKIKKIAKTIAEATTLDQKEVRRQFKEKTGREYKDSTNEERNQFKRNMVDEQLRQARQEIQSYLSSDKKSSTIEKNTSVNADLEESVIKSNSTQSSNTASTAEIINLVQEVAKNSVIDTSVLSTAFKETTGKEFNSATSQEKESFSKEAFLNNISKATQGIEEFFTKKETLETQKSENDKMSKLAENETVNKTQDTKNFSINKKSALEKSESVSSQTKKVIETLKIVAESNIDLTNKKEVLVQSKLVSSTLLNKDIDQIDKITSDESKSSSSVINKSQERNNTQSTQGIAEFFSKKSTDESKTKTQGIAEFFNKKTTDESGTKTQGIAEFFNKKTTEESDTKTEESDRKTQTQGIAEFFSKQSTDESQAKTQGIEEFFSKTSTDEKKDKRQTDEILTKAKNEASKSVAESISKSVSLGKTTNNKQQSADSEEITIEKINKAFSKTNTDSKESIFKASKIIGVVEDAMSQTSKAVSTKVNRVFTEKKESQSVTKDTPFSSDKKPKVNNTPTAEEAFKIKKESRVKDSNTTTNRVFKDVLDMNKTTIGLGRQQVDKQTSAMSANDLQPLINALNSAGANINNASAGMANIASKNQQATIEDIYPTNF